MTPAAPDRQTMLAALALGTRAPSIHNTQPWRWRIGESTVHLYAAPGLRLIHTDPDGRELMLSCGAVLHHTVVAFAALGWQAIVRRFPDPDDDDHLASLELRPWTPTQSDIALVGAIPRRRTDRRIFAGWQVPLSDIGFMAARAARLGVTLRRVTVTETLTSTVHQSISQHSVDHDYLTELSTWSGKYAAVAGVPARSAPQPDFSAALPSRIFAGPVLSQPIDATAADDNAMLLALGTATDSRVDQLRAGEASSAVLLTATVQGLATCPMTEALEIPQCRQIIRSEVFDDDLFPQILIRVGWAPINADPLPSTPRRPLADVVSWLKDEPQA